jgi:hypothetical protein
MTRTGRALVIGRVVVLGLSLTAVAAVPAEPRPVVVESIAAHPPGSEGAARVLTLPGLADLVAPLALAALCGTAVAFFSAGRRPAARAGALRRSGRG